MKLTSLFVLALSLGAQAIAQADHAATASANLPAPVPPIPSLDLSAIDKSADPCADFYQYACGGWEKSHPIPADQTIWARSFSLLQERNRYLLWKELEAAASSPATPLEKQYGDFYAACMDSATVEQKGLTPLQPFWKQIDSLKRPRQIPALLIALSNSGVPAGLFHFTVAQDDKDSSKEIAQLDQGGLSLPDRDYYIVDSPRFQTIRAQYVEHIKKMFTLAGDSPELAAAEAADVLRIETALAQASTSRTDLRDPANRYHIYTVAQLQKQAPNFAWQAYFNGVGIGHFDTLNVAEPGFFQALSNLLKNERVTAWKSYLRWQIYHHQATYLPKAVFDENFAFFGKTLSGQKEPKAQWKRCVALTDEALGEAVGQNWVKRNFPPEAKQSMDKLVAALEKSLGDDIKTLPWMSETTRKAAAEKLALIRNKIGYPEKWKDYSSIHADRADLAGNLRQHNIFERNYAFAKLGQPVDEKEWQMTPPTVNAYYDPSFNDINFPAGILQPPFFDVKSDPAVNFGAIGVVIGHELTHGFDDEGSQYDGHGNLREWQTPEDRKAFEERTGCLADEYSGFVAAPARGEAPEQKLNGKLTLGENTADNGGLRIAYMALLDTLAAQGKSIDDTVDGYSERQRYFLGFAQVWCQNQTDEAARQRALVDPHSPGRWRVNGSVRNFEEFGKAFGCAPGRALTPIHSCRVW